MMKLFLVGCGTGNPDHITMEGLKALRAAQLILLPVKAHGNLHLQIFGARF